MSIVEVVEKFVKMWYNTFACERQIVVCGGVWMCGIATDLKKINRRFIWIIQ